MACETPIVGTADNPLEFSRAVRYAERCDDGRAIDETVVGPAAVALVLGSPSRAFPGAPSARGSLNRLHGA